MPLTFLIFSISIGFLVFLLNYTDFIAEYGKVACRFFSLREYEKWKADGGTGYPTFIREKYNNFWGRMFGCPYCLVTFSNLILQSLFTSPLLFLVGAFVSTLVWGICTLLYFAVNKNYN
jgi:hypothetical protein